jgi:hypothetical protein
MNYKIIPERFILTQCRDVAEVQLLSDSYLVQPETTKSSCSSPVLAAAAGTSMDLRSPLIRTSFNLMTNDCSHLCLPLSATSDPTIRSVRLPASTYRLGIESVASCCNHSPMNRSPSTYLGERRPVERRRHARQSIRGKGQRLKKLAPLEFVNLILGLGTHCWMSTFVWRLKFNK